MDLSQFSCDYNQPTEMQLIHPVDQTPIFTDPGETGAPAEAVSLLVVGVDSDAFKEADRKITNRRFSNPQFAKGKLKVTAEQTEAELFERVTSCVVGFKNIEVDGKKLEFNKQNLVHFMKKFPCFYRQLREFVDDNTNFFKAS